MVTHMARKKSKAVDINRISGFSVEDAERLSKKDIEIKTVEALWGKNRDDIAGHLERTGQTSSVKLEILYAVLIADALGALSKKGWWRKPSAAANQHKGELALYTLLVLAVALMVYRVASAVQSFTGTPLTEAQLLSKELSVDIRKRFLIALPVEQGTAGQEIKVPATVWLLLPSTNEKAPAAVIVKDVLLLSVRQDGERTTATVAVMEQGLNEMKDFVGRTKAIVIQPTP